MKTLIPKVTIAMVLLLVMCGIVAAAPSTRNITYQGILENSGGNPLTGPYSMTFRLYNVTSGGTALSTDTHSITADKGLFTTQLTFDPSYINGQALWLGITVGKDPEMTPRQEIRPVPYALNLVPATRTRTISFPANALNYDESSQIIRQYAGSVAGGLLWSRDSSSGAYLFLQRPDDWDGASNVVMNIYFYPTTSTSGDVDFFIRPRAFNPSGDILADANSFDGIAVPVAGSNAIKKQTFSIPASKFGSKELWEISIQNQGFGSTYPDNVVVMAVSLTYTAIR
jgi:hypothetical protein